MTAASYESSILVHPVSIQSTTQQYAAQGPILTNIESSIISSYDDGAGSTAASPGSLAPVLNVTTTTNNAADQFYAGLANDQWESSPNSMRIVYSSAIADPDAPSQGGVGLSSQQIGSGEANNASLEYSLYFPADFDFVKGGKLPGLYGGPKGCSGRNQGPECVSSTIVLIFIKLCIAASVLG